MVHQQGSYKMHQQEDKKSTADCVYIILMKQCNHSKQYFYISLFIRIFNDSLSPTHQHTPTLTHTHIHAQSIPPLL